MREGRPWGLSPEDRVLLVAAYWRTNLTLRQLAPPFGVSKSAADRIIDPLGPLPALRQHRRFRRDVVLFVDGTPAPTRDHEVADGRPLPGNRNDCMTWETSGAQAAPGKTTTIADGGYRGTGAPACPTHTDASRIRVNCPPGKRTPTPRTAKSAPASSTPSPA